MELLRTVLVIFILFEICIYTSAYADINDNSLRRSRHENDKDDSVLIDQTRKSYSQSRAPKKLIEEEECRVDINRLCATRGRLNDNLVILECLQTYRKVCVQFLLLFPTTIEAYPYLY